MLKYKCLILDHDDTTVDSTATVHYPAFVEYMKLHHPEINLSLEEYFLANFDPGVVALFTDICGMTVEEMREALDPRLYIGRCPEQVDALVSRIRPLLMDAAEEEAKIEV